MNPEIGLISIAQLSDMARAAAELTEEEMRQLPIASRFVVSREITWEIGKSPPGNPDGSLYVFGLFVGDDDHDVIAYILPRDAKNPAEPHWMRYTLNRVSPTLLIETMVRSTFLTAVGAELYKLAVDNGIVEDPDDEEPEETPEGTPAQVVPIRAEPTTPTTAS